MEQPLAELVSKNNPGFGFTNLGICDMIPFVINKTPVPGKRTTPSRSLAFGENII